VSQKVDVQEFSSAILVVFQGLKLWTRAEDKSKLYTNDAPTKQLTRLEFLL
jgi:hypothetical protein